MSMLLHKTSVAEVGEENSRRVPLRRLRQSLGSSRYDWTGRSGVDVGWSEAETFGCAESEDSVLEMSVTRETDLVLWAGLS